MAKDDNTVRASDEDAHYAKGRDWEADKLARIEKSERRAWFVAGAFAVVAIAGGIGMAGLAPLKSVSTTMVVVDKATGGYEIVDAIDQRKIVGYQDLLDKHWSTNYVQHREAYDYKLLQSDYDSVLSMSDDGIGREYAAQYEGPNARDKKLGAGMDIKVDILSVTLTPDNVGQKAVVRFSKTAHRANADHAEDPQYFVATISYEYHPSMRGKEKELLLNPLGFKVTGYRVASEIAPTTSPATPK